uniref:hypothetical protein n=1 Tax=Agathobacter sp. TaxID=2021311 RepID=UPI004055F7EE
MEHTAKKRNLKSKRKKKAFPLIPVAASGVAVILACAFLLVSCGSGYDADTSTVFVKEDGKIVTVDVEEFDEGTYSESELKSYVQECIDLYNEENADSVKKKKLSIKDNTATLVLEFADRNAYEAFYGIELFCGTVAEALENGYAFDVEFAKISDGKAVFCEAEEILNTEEELKAIVIKSNTDVEIDGEILYVSAENISDLEPNRVSIKSGNHISNLEVYGEESAKGTEGTEGTETTEDDSSVGEDELLITTEEKEMAFDFGETESAGSRFSEVYTYIIYK